MVEIWKNLDIIRDNIARICKKHNKDKKDINLIAVSKTILPTRIEDAIKWGCKSFGENRVEEAQSKWIELKNKYPDVKLHLIGHLQSKKIKNAVRIFDFIHSVDSLKLAQSLKDESRKQNKDLHIFIQVNIGSEEAKTGFKLEEIDVAIDEIKNKIKLPIFGLMCIPPANEEPSLYFALLNKIAKRNKISNLSMGMSNDYEMAIAMNSSYIRVGSAIFNKDIN